MRRLAITLSTLCLLAVPAQAARIEFRGTFHITSANQTCIDAGSAAVGHIWSLRYNPPNLGDNGPATQFSILEPTAAVAENYALQSGSLIGTVFRPVDGAGVARSLFTFPASMRISSQTPATLLLTTVSVTLAGDIKEFDGTPGCRIGFVATGYARVSP